MKFPPWFPLAAMVTSAFVIIIAVWITVFHLAKDVNIQPLEEDYQISTDTSPDSGAYRENPK